MRGKLIGWGMGVAVLVAGVAAAAEPVDGKTARGMLYRGAAVEVESFPDDRLPAAHMAAIETVAAQQLYYAAVAVSPEDGVLSAATLAAANHHSTDAAEAAALAGCNAAREGATPCIIVALVRPRGWEPRAFQLGALASDAFRKEYRRGRGPKAFAISPETGEWAIAKGEGAESLAVEDCNGKAGTGDCEVAVAD